MKEKLKKILAIVASGTLLALSVGMIIWMSQDEKVRLAERERVALEQARLASEAEAEERLAMNSPVGSADEAEKTLHDINTLLLSLEKVGLPEIE